MKKKTIISIIAAGVVATCVAIVAIIVTNNNSGRGNTSPADPTTATIVVNTNGGVPYAWKYEIADPDVVEFITEESVTEEHDEPITGGPVRVTYTFKGLKEGETEIKLTYASIVDADVAETRKYKVAVDKNRHTIIEQTEVVTPSATTEE